MDRKISDYEGIVGPKVIEELKYLGEKVKGISLLHINSTMTGGGVAEMLHYLIPLFNDLGIDARWEVIKGSPLFFKITKSFHNAFQGNHVKVGEEMLERYRQINEQNAKTLDLNSDIVVIHDPQPLAMIDHRPLGENRWIWRCHIDISQPDEDVWNSLLPYITKYDVVISSAPEFAKYLPVPQDIIPPSIDPLSDKNRELPAEVIDKVYQDFGIPRDKPVLLQVSRFDGFKDPIGVVEAYNLIKRNIDCSLVLAGGLAHDDPEGTEMLARVRAKAGNDPNIHIITADFQPLEDIVINALQRGADVVIQKSLKEGFALVVAEALWKGKPVVGSDVGGLRLQIKDGINGFLVRSIEETAERVSHLLRNPELAREMGECGREYVRKNFLITRHLRDYLRLFSIIDPRH
jgi:trehalose synthase